jgi:hypothetical protein
VLLVRLLFDTPVGKAIHENCFEQEGKKIKKLYLPNFLVDRPPLHDLPDHRADQVLQDFLQSENLYHPSGLCILEVEVDQKACFPQNRTVLIFG